MSTNVNNYFTKGPQGTLALLPKSNFSYKGEKIPVYDNTEIDRWYVGSFSSATYFITVEYDSNQKETMQILVVARPEQASFTVFGRTSIEDELIEIDATVSASYLSLKASPKDPAFAGARLGFIATYAETMAPLGPPTEVTGGGGGGGGLPPSISTTAYGTIFVSGQDDLIAESVSDSITVVGGAGIQIETDSNAKSLTINTDSKIFKNIAVAGQPTIIADSLTDTLTVAAGSGISLTTNSTTDTLTISSSGNFNNISVSDTATLVDVTVSGTQTVTGDLNVTGTGTIHDLTISGNLVINGTTTTINSTTLDIDDVNITLGKGATTAAAVDGGGITLDGAYANFVWDNGNASWSSNKSIIPTTNDALNFGAVTRKWGSVYASNFIGSIATPSQNNITAVGVLNSLTVSGGIIGNGGVTATSLTVSGLTDLTGATETVTDVTSAATTTYNFATSGIFYHSTSPGADWTANFNNLPTTNGKVTTMNIIVPQGGTAYKITAASIEGTPVTIKWIGSSTPSGNANKIDIWAFSFIRRANSWTVFASQSANFG